MTVLNETLDNAFKNTPSGYGICAVIQRAVLVGDISKYTGVLLKQRMFTFLQESRWYSGESSYPIADIYLSAKDAFYSTEDLWDASTSYGRRRLATYKDLCEYLEKMY